MVELYRELPAYFTTERVYSDERPVKIPNYDPSLQTFASTAFFITFNFSKLAPSYVGNNFSPISFELHFDARTTEPLAFCAFTQERSAISISPNLSIVPLIIK